jgi:phage terminase small subunit
LGLGKMAGRKRKPTKLKILQGTARKDRMTKNEPQPELGMPDIPDWLSPEGIEEWGRVMAGMGGLGVIAKIDAGALAMYCQLMGKFVKAQREGLPVLSAEIAQIRALMAAFGLEPSSRARLSGTNQNDPSNRWAFK